jgi:hypothetical protein
LARVEARLCSRHGGRPAAVKRCSRRWLIQAVRWVLLGDNPIRVGAVKTQGDQPAQVEPSGPVVKPVIILGDPAVAQPAVATSKPGDGAFNHGPVLAIFGQPVRVTCGLPGGA